MADNWHWFLDLHLLLSLDLKDIPYRWSDPYLADKSFGDTAYIVHHHSLLGNNGPLDNYLLMNKSSFTMKHKSEKKKKTRIYFLN